MKRLMINIFAVLTVSALCITVAQAQQVRVALNGDAYLIKDGGFAALEVGGKIVIGFDEEFTDITSPDGKYFIADYDGEDFYLYDRGGNEVVLGDELAYSYDKLSIVDGTIVATRKGKTRYFSAADPSKEIKVQQAGADFFDKGRDFNPEKMTRSKAAAEAERLSALVAPEGRFEIRQKANSQRQEIVVRGKVLHEAQEYTVLSDETWWKEKGFWVLVAKNSGKYGVVGIDAYADDKTGEWHSGATQLIPYEYTFARNHDGTGPMITCTTISGAPHFFNYYGWRFDLDARTGKYSPMNMRWVHDKATDKWTLQKKSEN